jgi:hypothetical protein
VTVELVVVKGTVREYAKVEPEKDSARVPALALSAVRLTEVE